jgi:hypothetical protein
MYENLQVVGWLWHISFIALCFGLWHQFVGLRLERVDDFLIYGAFLVLGMLAFPLLVVGVFIRWLGIKSGWIKANTVVEGTASTFYWNKKLFWMYQARKDWAGGVLAWVGFWFGVFAATYTMVIS